MGIYADDDDDADVIKYKALDTICMKYGIEEEQLKHVLYVNFIITSQAYDEVISDNGSSHRSKPWNKELLLVINYM